MDYALIKENIVENIIYLHPMNAADFPSAVSTEGLPIQIGDTYENGKFYRDGVEITENASISTEQEFLDRLTAEVSE